MKAKILEEIFAEVERAERLNPLWPEDRVEGAAIVMEEAGEALKEALNMRPYDRNYAKSSPLLYWKELIQTAAMALRALKEEEKRCG